MRSEDHWPSAGPVLATDRGRCTPMIGAVARDDRR
jgi:hypothetical protein